MSRYDRGSFPDHVFIQQSRFFVDENTGFYFTVGRYNNGKIFCESYVEELGHSVKRDSWNQDEEKLIEIVKAEIFSRLSIRRNINKNIFNGSDVTKQSDHEYKQEMKAWKEKVEKIREGD